MQDELEQGSIPPNLKRLVAYGTREELTEWFVENFDNEDSFWPRNWYTSMSTLRLRQTLLWHAGLIWEPLTAAEVELARRNIWPNWVFRGYRKYRSEGA